MFFENLLTATEHLAGFVIVMTTLSVLWGLTALMGRVVARFDPAMSTGAPRSNVQRTNPSPRERDDVVDDDLLIIAAATATMLDSRHRIVSIRPDSK
jgi:Na+-transporting methylmalonyl-CoA/oxaloacetate decarboxylase gamma subunit